ncbi:hypothetical protein BKA62DRAFT_726628 [Auriculariales sp. MPI-PUGE-AT-0066]|nr:hypothetical protein BKA62DRAFT_726628 [Auriculariales sp. MPI-PUGE-AT-0066]
MGVYRSILVVAAAIAAAAPLFVFLYRSLRSRTVFRFTVIPDIPSLGKPARRKHGTVVICGGSIGGCLAAKICSDHFTRVIVIEQEAWALSEDARHGRGSRVYQYTSFHGFFQGALLNILRALFTNFDERAKQYDVGIVEMNSSYWLNGRCLRFLVQRTADNSFVFPSKILSTRRSMETAIRNLVEYVHGTVTSLKTSPNSSISDVDVRLGTDGGSMVNFDCDMFIDCSGNAQAGLKLLPRAVPADKSALLSNIRHTYSPKIKYSTLEFPPPPNFEEDLNKITVQYPFERHNHPVTYPLGKYPFFLFWSYTQDIDDRIIYACRTGTGNIVIMLGSYGTELPCNIDQLRMFLRDAPAGERSFPSWFFQVLDLLDPVKDDMTCTECKVDSCSRVFYERVSNALPRNFVALGDAMMRLSPRYGEGVAQCAIGITTLDGVLRRIPEGPHDPAFSKSFFSLLASRAGHLWDGSRLMDYGYSTTKPVAGEKLSDGAFLRWFVSKAAAVIERDDGVNAAFNRDWNMLAPSSDMQSPSIVLKVFWNVLFPAGV